MRRLMLMISLIGLSWGLVGCGGSDEPKKDAEAKTVKAPELPPSGP